MKRPTYKDMWISVYITTNAEDEETNIGYVPIPLQEQLSQVYLNYDILPIKIYRDYGSSTNGATQLAADIALRKTNIVAFTGSVCPNHKIIFNSKPFVRQIRMDPGLILHAGYTPKTIVDTKWELAADWHLEHLKIKDNGHYDARDIIKAYRQDKQVRPYLYVGMYDYLNNTRRTEFDYEQAYKLSGSKTKLELDANINLTVFLSLLINCCKNLETRYVFVDHEQFVHPQGLEELHKLDDDGFIHLRTLDSHTTSWRPIIADTQLTPEEIDERVRGEYSVSRMLRSQY